MTPEEAQEVSGISDLRPLDAFTEDFAALVFRQNLTTLCLDMEHRQWADTQTPALRFAAECRANYPAMQFLDLYPIFGDLRLIKTPFELERMRKAMEITRKGLEAMMLHARPNMYEYEMEAYFDFTLMQNGVRHKAFSTIAAAGERATILHYSKNDGIAKDGDLWRYYTYFPSQWQIYTTSTYGI